MTRRASCDCDRLGRSRDDECVHADPCPADPLITEAPEDEAVALLNSYVCGHYGRSALPGKCLRCAGKALADVLVVERQARQEAETVANMAALESSRLDTQNATMREAIWHVIADSPGTPDSVKRYLAAAAGSGSGEPT